MSCTDCFHRSPSSLLPTGTITTLYDVQTYTTSPSEIRTPGKSKILLLPDAFGLNLPNTLLLADALALRTGLVVYVPDIIPGGPMDTAVLPLMDTFTSPTASGEEKQVSLREAMAYVAPFRSRAAPEAETSRAPSIAFAQAMRAEMSEGAKLGVAGYCWGGHQALHIASTVPGLVDAVFIAHPAAFQPGAVVGALNNGVKLSFAHAGNDMSLPFSLIEETKEKVGEVEGWELRVYEECAHGFAVRGAPGSEKEGAAAKEALEQAGTWMERWL